MSRTARVLLCLAMALPISLGATTALAQSPEPYPLGIEIVLTQMAGTDIAPDAGITATFATNATNATNDSDGSLFGSGGCNAYSATWRSDGTTLSVGPISATLIGCEPPVSERESQYLRLLQAAVTWSLDGTTVTVVSADGSTLVFGSGVPDAPAIVGEWRLVTFGGTPIPAGIVATAIFGADGSLTGSGGCNTFNGAYTVDGASLSISTLAATRMACATSGEIEPAYLDMLEAATGWSVVGQTLTIDSTVALVFTSGTAPEGTLTGQAWSLVTIGGEAVDPALGTSALFAEDGTVSGSGGCNQYNAGYAVDGTSVSIGPIAATRMACASPVAESEAAFFAAMEAAVGYVVSGSDLVIAASDGSTLEFRAGAVPTPAPTPAATAAAPSASATGVVGSWQMTEIAGQAIPGGFLDIDITFAADGTLSGNGGCNDYTGGWSLSGSTIALRDLVIGMGGTCDPTTQSLEQSFWSLLPFVDVAEVAGDTLSLAASLGGNVGFVFVAAD